MVLGLADHFDEIVAKAMNVEKELITLARQWHITLERAAFTEGVDKVKEVLEREQEATTTQQENIKEVVEEVEMRIEEERITETKKIMEVKPAKPTRQDLQHQETADNTTKKEGKNKVLEEYEEAKAKLEKKKDEFDQLNLILEEKTEKENPKKRKVLQNEKKTKEARETQAKQELEEVQKKRATLSDQTEKREYSTSSSSRKRKEVLSERTEDKKISPVKDKGKRKMYEPETSLKEKEDSHKSNDLDREQKPYSRIEETITVWNIPYHITRSQVFFAIKYLERVKNIEMIRESSGKTRAEVSFEEGSSFIQGIETWIVPLTNELLVRITPGANRKEILENRKQHIAKLYNILQNVNEVLLLRQLKHTGAKAVHIFKNSNGNNKGYALVSFRNQREKAQAQKYAVKYYDTRLFWEAYSTKQEEAPFTEEKYKHELYMHNPYIRNFKKQELGFDKTNTHYRNKEESTEKKDSTENRAYIKSEK